MDGKEEATPSFGQNVFYESTEKSVFSEILARAALNLGGHAADYPVDLAEIVRRLPWRECQSVLAMASLAASAPFRWSADQEKRLVEWAADPHDQTGDDFLAAFDSAAALVARYC